MFGDKPVAVRMERIEMGVAQLRADLQRLDRRIESQVEAIRQEMRELKQMVEQVLSVPAQGP